MENLCHRGCGKPGLFQHAKTGEFRCSKNVSNCPAIRAMVAIKQATRTIEIQQRKQEMRDARVPELCACGKIGTYFSERMQHWRCVPHKTKGQQCPAEQEKFNATMIAKYGTTDMSKIEGVQARRSVILREQHAARGEEGRKAIDVKRRDTMEERYGSRNYLSIPEVKEQIRIQNLERYGVEHTLQVQEFRDKGKETMLSTIGYDHPLKSPEIREAMRLTCVAEYGVDNPMQNAAIFEKSRVTNLRVHGARAPMHNAEIAEKVFKSGRRTKEVTMESGIIHRVQGYEPYAITYLLALGYTENDLAIAYSEKPVVPWIDKTTKNRKYYPDIFLKFENHIIEVKSDWSMNNPIWHEMNLQKQQASLDAGFKFTFLIFDERGILTSQNGDKLNKEF